MDPGSALIAVGVEVAEIASALATDYAARKAARKTEELTGVPLSEAFRADPVGNKVEELVDSLLSRSSPESPPARRRLPYFTQDPGPSSETMSATPKGSSVPKGAGRGKTPTRHPKANIIRNQALLAEGSPAYTPRTTAAANAGIFSQKSAKISTGPEGRVTIHHTEFLGSGDVRTNVVSPGQDFYLREFRINPSNPETFPWLSGIAANFERYKLDWVKIHYVPRIGTTTVGSVMMAPDFDVNDPFPTTEAELTQMRGAVEGPAFESFVLHMPGQALHTGGPLYTKGSIRAGDARLSDAAMAYIATAGNATVNALLGRVYIEYKVQLLDPHDGDHDDTLPAAQLICIQASDSSRSVTTSPTFAIVGNSGAGHGAWNSPAGRPYRNQSLYSDGNFTIPRGVWQVTAHMEFTSPGAGHVYTELQQYDGSSWVPLPHVNVGGGTATTSDLGSTTTTGVFLQQYDHPSIPGVQPGHVRMTIYANTSFTLTDLDYVVCFRPA